VARALLIFKPDAAYRRAPRAAINRWLRERSAIRIEALRWFQPPRPLVEKHYDFLAERPFFPWLVDFMTALPVVVGRLHAKPDELERMRVELGETRIHESRPGSLRELYGIAGGINCLHLSDSPETGEREVDLWAAEVEPWARVEVDFPRADRAPDHTFHLRSLAGQYAAGVHRDTAAAEMRRLLREEVDLEGEGLETFYRVIFGAFA
jgi:nucleoside-diphosphate kinase